MTWVLWLIVALYGFALLMSVWSEHERRKEQKAWWKRHEEMERKAALTYEARDQFWNKLMH